MISAYTTRIRWLKIILPMLAIAVIVGVLGFNWRDDSKIIGEFKADDKVFADNALAVEKPLLNINTVSGDRYRLEAQNVESIDGVAKRFFGGEVSGELLIAGTSWKLKAGEGRANIVSEIVEFKKSVVGLMDGGYTIISERLMADVKKQIVTSPYKVKVSNSSGHVIADKMVITGAQNARVFTFTGHVKGQYIVGNANEVK